MSRKKREVIFVANIDYGYSEKDKSIKKDGYLGTNEVPVSKLIEDAKLIITNQLPTDLADIFGIHAEVRFIDTRPGSINIFFGVVISGITLIANYKKLYDSMTLIAQHCNLLIDGMLKEKYPYNLSAGVSMKYPVLGDPRDMYLPKSLRRFFGGKGFGPGVEDYFLELSQLHGIQGKRRDGFFWFLLSLCIILLIIVGILVYAAVVKTYFP